MKYLTSLSLVALAALVVAAPDPLITPIAQLHPRQASNPALVGYISSSGASAFSESRTCDFPATLSRSGSLAQCCAASAPCNFYSTCSGGTLFAASASVFCDNGFCNTGVIVATPGGTSGQSFLGCWPTQYGSAPITLVANAPVASATGASAASSGGARSSGSGASGSSGASPSSSAAESQASAKPTGAAAKVEAGVVTHLLGMAAGLVALL